MMKSNQNAELTIDRIVVQVHRSSTPSTDKHLLALFEQLNATETIYPGTELQLVYEFVGKSP